MNVQDKTLQYLENHSAPEESRGKLYYGWVVAVASAVCLLAANNFQYSFGVFLKPLIAQFGWSRAAISACVTIRSVMSGLMSPISGSLSDRIGTRKLILAAVSVVALSYLLAARIQSLFGLYLILGILTGLGNGFTATPLIATTTKWFGRKAGTANGILMSGFGVAQITLPPLATYLILQYGWGTCFMILGLSAFAVGSAMAGLMRDPPPAAAIPAMSLAGAQDEDNPPAEAPGASDHYSLSEAFHTSSFWIMLFTYMMTALTYQMVVIHIVAAAVDGGASLEAAAFILTLSGVTNTLGRLLAGGLANRLGMKRVLAVCLAIQVPALFSLAGAQDILIFYIMATVNGLAYAGTSPIFPAMAGDYFGTKAMGSIYGILMLGYTFGAATGPLLAGTIFDITGSYDMAFLAASAVTLLSFLLSLLLRRPGISDPWIASSVSP